MKSADINTAQLKELKATRKAFVKENISSENIPSGASP